MDGQQPAYAPGCCPLRTYPLALVLSSVMNIRARLVRLAPSTVAVGRVVFLCIGYKNILVNLDDAPKVERIYRSGDLRHERAQRATYSSETLENGSR